MRIRLIVALLATTLLASVPPASAHGVVEANELEMYLLSDEGTDSIEPYGGFDINAIFIGFAHDPSVGSGAAGDGFYLRAELYGLMAESLAVGQGTWTVTFTITTPQGPVERTLTTTDGVAFSSDFDSLLVEVETDSRSTSVLRAFTSFASVGIKPGDAIGVSLVESRKDGDLRDVAPGGIPIPGTNGLLFYEDPTAIADEGVNVASVPAQGPGIYLIPSARATGPGAYIILATSALKDGGQHVYVQPRNVAGWTYTLGGTTFASIPAKGSLEFTLDADLGSGNGPLELDIFTDVGGRLPLTLQPDGTLTVGDLVVSAEQAASVASPGVGPLLGLALLGLAGLARRR
ncbi:MAG: hypothetical protein AABX89_00735 [Candidatus Thermoplasmatota archaeon]